MEHQSKRSHMAEVKHRLALAGALFQKGSRDTITLGDLFDRKTVSEDIAQIPIIRIEYVQFREEQKIRHICLLPMRSRDEIPKEIRSKLASQVTKTYLNFGERKVIQYSRLSQLTDIPILKQIKRFPRFFATVMTALKTGDF